MTRPTIYFVRHGETVSNVEQRIQGQFDSPLTPLGRAQARANADTLLKALPNVDAFDFVCSPLGRARATMEIIRSHLGVPPLEYCVDERLKEMSWGDWEGLLFTEMKSRFAQQWAERQASRWTYVMPGGESYQRLSGRLQSWLEDLAKDVIVVSHGGVGRILRGLFQSVAPEEIPFVPEPEHDRVYRLKGGTEALL